MKDLTTHSSKLPGQPASMQNCHWPKTGYVSPLLAKTIKPGGKLMAMLIFCFLFIDNRVLATVLAPVISSLSATRAAPGATITISGLNFNSVAAGNVVFFGGGKASVISGSATSLTVTVPFTATYAPVSVTNTASGLTAYSTAAFQPTYNNSAYAPNVVNFDTTRFINVPGNPGALVIGDIDGDGKADMVSTNFVTRTMLIYRSVSVSGSIDSGSFASPVSISADTGAYHAALGDLDGDGKLDIVVTSNADTGITVYRNTSSMGSISFAAGLFVPTLSTPTNGVIITDLDSDGKPDVAVSFDFGVFTFRNTSTPGGLSFDAGSYFDAAGGGGFLGSSTVGNLAGGDLDGDGKKDLATHSYSSNQVIVLRNTSSTGTISFAAKQAFAVGDQPSNLAIGDLDGDGKADLAVTNTGTSFSDTGSVSVLRNTSTSGSISFAAGSTFRTSFTPTSIAIASMSGGAKPDLVICSYQGHTLSLLRNMSTTGTFLFDTASHPFYTGMQSTNLAVGDLDGDGKPDVAVNNYQDYFSGGGSIAVLRNEPLGLLSGPAMACTMVMDSFAAATPHGRWNSSDSSIAIAYTGISNSSAYIQGISAGTATLTYTVMGGYTTTTVLVASGVPTPAAISGGSAVNAGANLSLSDAVAGGVWSASNGNATVSGGVVHGVTAGTVTISYTITNGCGWNYATKVVTVNPGTVTSVAAITGYFFYVCPGATAAFADATAGGSWSINSGDAAIASVSGTGVVTGISAGTARLSYTVGSSYATATVSVYPAPAAITGNASVCAGTTTALSDITTGGAWSSSIPSTATVGTGGVVTTINPGTVTIFYTLPAAGCKASKIVTVNANPAAITGPTKVCTGQLITLTDATAGGTWSGSNASGSVDGSGHVAGITAGTVPVTYTSGAGCSKTLNVLVNASPVAISGNRSVCTGKVIFVSDATTPGVSWTSGTPAVATISASGAVTGVIAGTSVITYTASNLCIATATVTVNTTPTVSAIIGAASVSRSGPGIVLTDATAGGVWTSSNTAILTVGSSTGVVYALVSAGSANINYIVTTAAGCSNFATKVISASPAPHGYGGTVTTTAGNVLTLADKANAGNWSSSDEAVATVDENGTVNAVSAGEIIITHTTTASDGSESAVTTTLQVLASQMQVSLVPNPNRGTFVITGSTGTKSDALLTYEITDMLGHIVYATTTTAVAGNISEQVQLSNNLANGTYLLNVTSGSGRSILHFIIEK